ncbi:hypothetical protein, partial [Acinetobacter indicus]|uniref:hypothetical protein n=2 Tax=Acinetobacter indicus TaxID=756892 RepID=UPI001BC87AE0
WTLLVQFEGCFSMAKYSQQFKLEVVQNYLSNKNDDGFRKTANKYKLDRATIRLDNGLLYTRLLAKTA